MNEIHKPPSSRNTSGLKGVSYEEDRDKFRVRLKINEHNLTLGRFENTHEGWISAGEQHDIWTRKLYGTYAYQNFDYEPYEINQFLMEFEDPLTENGKMYLELRMKGYRL
jgi:hypothetical protein